MKYVAPVKPFLSIKDNPLENAVVKNDRDLVRQLSIHTELLHQKNIDGNPPLHVAVIQNKKEMAKILLEAGADIEQTNDIGHTVLIQSILLEHFSILKLLIKKGANVNIKTKNKTTPLHFAAYHADERFVHALIRQGADINALNLIEETPVWWAWKRICHHECMNNFLRLLQEPHLRLEHKNKEHLTLMEYAMLTPHGELNWKYLQEKMIERERMMLQQTQNCSINENSSLLTQTIKRRM